MNTANPAKGFRLGEFHRYAHMYVLVNHLVSLFGLNASRGPPRGGNAHSTLWPGGREALLHRALRVRDLLHPYLVFHQVFDPLLLLAHLRQDQHPDPGSRVGVHRDGLGHRSGKYMTSDLSRGHRFERDPTQVATTIFQCNPVRGFWDHTVQASCKVDVYAFFIGNAVPNIITDWALLILPIPYVWRLQKSRVQKIALCGIFLLGGL